MKAVRRVSSAVWLPARGAGLVRGARARPRPLPRRGYASAEGPGGSAKKPEAGGGLGMIAGGMAIGGAGVAVYFLGAPDPETLPSSGADGEFGVSDVTGYVSRASDRVVKFAKGDRAILFSSADKELLPAPTPAEYRVNDFTLVLDLDRTLTYTEWTKEHGFRTVKRPGLQYFLEWARDHFGEVVLFSDKPVLDASTIYEKLDPVKFNEEKLVLPRLFTYVLFRESMREDKDGPLKDLNMLNRDLRKTIIVDDNPEMFRLHPENGVAITPYTGDPMDESLMELLPFLTAILNVGGNGDVRNYCRNFSQYPDVGKEFTARLKRAGAGGARPGPTPAAPAAPGHAPAPNPSGTSPAPAAAAEGGLSLLGVKLW